MVPHQVPIECLEVANVKSYAMPFRDWTLITKFRKDNLEEFICILAGFQKPVYQTSR